MMPLLNVRYVTSNAAKAPMDIGLRFGIEEVIL
jgi:hypothetical protein